MFSNLLVQSCWSFFLTLYLPVQGSTNQILIFPAIISDSENDQEEQLTPFTPSTKQQDECRAVIEQIRREDFGIGLELGEEESKLVQRQREREGRGLHRLSTELYSRDTHFVLELVQNADDNSYPEESSSAGSPSLVFVLERDKIVVLNNEFGFMEKNIRALCDVGRSTKGAHRYGYIGLLLQNLLIVLSRKGSYCNFYKSQQHLAV